MSPTPSSSSSPPPPRPPNKNSGLLLLLLLLLTCPPTLLGDPEEGGEDSVVVSSHPVLDTEEGLEGDEAPDITWGEANTNTVYFDPDSPSNVTAIVGHKASLPCHVINLGKKDVSWIRQRDLHILTLSIFTYTTDDRFQPFHPEDSEQWFLEINPVTFRDAGVYECQVSTSPKISLPITLAVEVQQARIDGPNEIYIQKGSTIRLTCRVNTHSDNVGQVSWYRNTHRLDYDSPRGGVSVEIEKTPTRTTSKLFITRATRPDVGNYTCVPQYADAASVMVHVVNGEESAAVHTAGSGSIHAGAQASPWLYLLLPLLHPLVQRPLLLLQQLRRLLMVDGPR